MSEKDRADEKQIAPLQFADTVTEYTLKILEKTLIHIDKIAA